MKGEESTSDFLGFASIPVAPAEQEQEPELPFNTTETPLTEKTEPAERIEQGEVKPVPTVQQRRFSVDWDPIQ